MNNIGRNEKEGSESTGMGTSRYTNRMGKMTRSVAFRTAVRFRVSYTSYNNVLIGNNRQTVMTQSRRIEIKTGGLTI